MKILHGLTGSVASTLHDKMKIAYIHHRMSANFVQTKSADVFSHASFGATLTYNDDFEWHYYQKEKKVLHIDLAQQAEVFVIAPCSANTLAKLANGICDNLLTCIARAWDFKKPFIIAPAMNTQMWLHPTTNEHLTKLESWGVKVVYPVEKKLFCGDTGVGALAPIEEIFNMIYKCTGTKFVEVDPNGESDWAKSIRKVYDEVIKEKENGE